MNSFSAAASILRAQGPAALFRRSVERLIGSTVKRPSPLRREDALAVDWSVPHPAVANPRPVAPGPITIAWIMSPPGEGSGGHQNIFRFLSYLEAAGHRVLIYLYSSDRAISMTRAHQIIGSPSYPKLKASMEIYGGAVADGVDAIFATGWETAYPAFRDASLARRLYFVQDFEPYFFPAGSDSVLAENTYHFGFTAITAGGWLASKLKKDYGMTTASFDFAADRSDYNFTNHGKRREILFYARPGTERRGFELGVMALELIARERPEIVINVVGWDVRKFHLPFEYVNLKSMPVNALNAIYNRCAAGLVLSMTNMSLLPLELVAAGVIPIVNHGDNNSMVSDNPFIEYTPPSPRSLADRIIAVFDMPDLPEHARSAAASLGDGGWSRSGEQFVAAVEEVLRG